LVRLHHPAASNCRGLEENNHVFTIRLKRHPIPGTIEIIRCLASVALELTNKHQTLQAQKSQALQFLSLLIHLFSQSNY